jgi:hypothetical protein
LFNFDTTFWYVFILVRASGFSDLLQPFHSKTRFWQVRGIWWHYEGPLRVSWPGIWRTKQYWKLSSSIRPWNLFAVKVYLVKIVFQASLATAIQLSIRLLNMVSKSDPPEIEW